MKAPTLFDGRGRPISSRKSATYAPGGYLGASNHRSRSYLPGMIADSRSDYTAGTRRELQRRAGFFKKNVGMVRGVAKSLVDHAVGPGIYPLAATSEDEWNRAAWSWFWETAKIGDVSGRMTLWEAQQERVKAKFWAGEMFTANSKSRAGWPQFQLIRAHNCGSFGVDESEGWRDGVKLDDANRARAYRFRLKGDERYQTLNANQVVHSYMLEESDGIRGVPPLASGFNNLHDILDTLSLEKESMKDNARVARWTQTESGEDEEEPSYFEDGSTSSEDAIAYKLDQVFGAEILRLKKGESVNSWSSARPSPAFMGLIAYLGKEVTNATGFPYEFAWDPNELKGPSVRFILEKVRLAVGEWKRNEIEDTYPFYTFAISCAMESGDLPYHPEWYKVEWIGGAPDVTIDKGRDGGQDRENIKAALTTFKRYYAAQGLWWKDELEQKAREAGYIDFLAEKYGVNADRIHLLMINQAQEDKEEPGKRADDLDRKEREEENEQDSKRDRSSTSA